MVHHWCHCFCYTLEHLQSYAWKGASVVPLLRCASQRLLMGSNGSTAPEEADMTLLKNLPWPAISESPLRSLLHLVATVNLPRWQRPTDQRLKKGGFLRRRSASFAERDVAHLQRGIKWMGWLGRLCTMPAVAQGSRSEPVGRDVGRLFVHRIEDALISSTVWRTMARTATMEITYTTFSTWVFRTC
jgi:hypothetical protein